MDRLVRDRGTVGRRLWRRRRRRSGAAGEPGALPHPDDADAADDGEDGDEVEPAPAPATPAPKRGMWAALKRALGADKPAPPPAEPSYLVVDPTREVLAVPRGAARLDAFEAALAATAPGSPPYRALALAFHKELLALTTGAGVDLALFDTRVQACARALMAAGEEERAGTLYLRVGRRHQAAELFVAAGAIDALEEAHAHIHWEEGGAKHEARLSFERFEALFLVGMRDQAFDALTKAHSLWRDNPIYAEIYTTFRERLGLPRRLLLTSGERALSIVGQWPIVIGRGEDAGVRVASPLVSRAHLQVERGPIDAALPVIVDLDSRGGTRIDGAPLVGKQPLPAGATIDMGGVVVCTRDTPGALWLHPALAPQRRTLASKAVVIRVPPPNALDDDGGDDVLTLHFDARGRAVADPPAVVNGEALQKKLLLLEGDKVGRAGWHWTVARSR